MNKQALLQLIDKVTYCAMSFAQDPKNEHASRRLQDAQQSLIKALSPFFGSDGTPQAQQKNLSVIEQQQGEIDALRLALVYVAHAGHVTPLYMLPKGVMLCDGDGVVVRVPNGPEVWGGNVSDYEKRRLATHPQATEPALNKPTE